MWSENQLDQVKMSDEALFNSESISDLPDHLLVYQHQAGGHGLLAKWADYMMLRHPHEPIVYKRLPPDKRGSQEANFYFNVFATNAPPEIAKLRPIVPAFHGVFQDSNNVLYIGLEDVLANLTNPSVCDLKMGRVACPPDASEAKIKAENAKYAHRDTVGFLFTGTKVYDQKLSRYLTVPRHYGRTLDLEAVYANALLPFLQGDLRLAHSFLPLVEAVRSVFAEEPQPPIGFYRSSLLLAYDQYRSEAVVRLVDFAHWRPASKANDPSGIIHGLNTLVGFLSRPELPPDLCYSAPFSVV